MHAAVSVPQAPRQGNDLTEGQLHHGARIGVGSIEHGNPRSCRSWKIDLIGPNAEGANREQLRMSFQHPLSDVCPGANAEKLDTVKGIDQFDFIERAGKHLDLVAPAFKRADGLRMDVL